MQINAVVGFCCIVRAGRAHGHVIVAHLYFYSQMSMFSSDLLSSGRVL